GCGPLCCGGRCFVIDHSARCLNGAVIPGSEPLCCIGRPDSLSYTTVTTQETSASAACASSQMRLSQSAAGWNSMCRYRTNQSSVAGRRSCGGLSSRQGQGS